MMTTTTSTSRRSSSSRYGVSEVSVAQAVGRPLTIRCSTPDDGDFHRTEVPFDELEARRRGFVDLPWTQLDQVHGTQIRVVDAPGAADGEIGDVAFTSLDNVVLGCWVGDCAPIVLVGESSEFAVVHAGWRGLAAGVVQRAIGAFTEPVVAAVLGPVIEPCCYEFGIDDLAEVAAGVGSEAAQVTGATSEGEIALDVPAAVRAACDDLHVERIGGCTGCGQSGFSHRARREPQRHIVAAWRPSEMPT
jgi:copper oxidase (laccase) domain-containing protein